MIQVHLALNHLPLALSLTGAGLLAWALYRRSDELARPALVVCLLAGALALPVSLTGDRAADAVERLPGVSEAAVESHEEAG